MKQVICKNCGAAFDEDLEKCPHCGTMNRKGAYKRSRLRVAGLIDRMLGLRDEAYQSISRMILLSVFRSLLIIAVVIGLAVLAGSQAKVNYYNNKEMDQKAYDTILWEDENLEKLDEAYAKEDFAAIRKLYAENSRVVSHWVHYPSWQLKEKLQSLTERDYFSKYDLQNILYFLYYPEYYTGRNGMKNVDAEEYEGMKQTLLEMMAEHGYTEEELDQIYHENADKYGYVTLADIETYVKE